MLFDAEYLLGHPVVIGNKENPKIPSFRAIGHDIELNLHFDDCLQIDDIIIT